MIEAADQSPEDFTITYRREILFHLRQLIEGGDRVIVTFDEGRESFVTVLLRVDEQRNNLIFDWGGSEPVNRRLLESPRAYFVATPGGVRNQFSTGSFTKALHESRPAFATTLPEKYVRLQRRQFFRLALPLTHRPSCSFPADQTAFPSQMSVVDLGVDGVGLEAPGRQLPFVIGQVIPGAIIDLGKPGRLEINLDLRHYELINRGARHIVHVGCRFIALSPAQELSVQRFIIHAQRDEKARLG